MADEGLKIINTVDNSQLEQSMRNARKAIRDSADTVVKEGERIDAAFDKISKKAAALAAGFSVKEFVSKMISVRGEFQQLEVSFTTMLGSAEKANKLMGQMIETAAKTPFDLKGVAEGAKQLLAYGEAAENINDDLKRLGNIAAGMSLPLSDLIYLYGTTMSQGRLYARDVLQFSGRGIPLVQELQKQFGATREEINKMVSDGKIGFPQVKEAIVSMTSSGGQFYNLMEEQSKTITGQISNLQDSFDMMFNDLGKQNEGLINDALSGIGYLIEHYKEIGAVLKPLIISYGTYKAALIATAAVEKVIAAGRSVQYFTLLTTRIGAATAAQRAFNLAALKNPYVIMGAAAASLLVTLYTLSKRTNEYTAQLEEANAKLEEQEKALAELAKQQDIMEGINKRAADSIADQVNKVQTLQSAIEDETNSVKDRRKAIKEMQALVPNYEASLNNEGVLYVKNKTAVDDYIESLRQLAIAKGLQAKREELTAQQLNAELDRRQAVRDRKKAEEEARKTTANRQRAQRERDAANARERNIVGGATAGFAESGIATRGADMINSQPLQIAIDKEKAARANLKVAQNAVALADKTIEKSQQQLGELDSLLKEYKDKGLLPDEKQSTTPTATTPKKTKADPRVKNEAEIAKAILDLQDDNERERVALMEEGTEKRLALSKLEYEQRKDELDRQHALLIQKRGGNLTDDEEKSFTDARLLNEQKYRDEVTKIVAEEFDIRRKDMNEYLKEYGTYQQQKLAIENEYAERIKKARSEGEKLSLQAEWNTKVASLDANRMAMNVDWSQAFRGVGDVLSDIARDTLKEVKAYMETEEFKKLSPEGKKAYTDLAAKLQQEGAGEASSPFNFKIWGTIEKNVKDYQDSVKNLKDVEDAHTQAVEKLRKAQLQLEKATDEASKALAQDLVNSAQSDVTKTAADVKEAEQKKAKAQSDLKENTDKASQGLANFTNAVNEIANGSLYGFANGIVKLINSFRGVSDGLGEIGGKVGGIVGAILQIIDALGDDPAQFIRDLLDKVATVIEKVLEDLPQIIVSALSGVGNIVTGVVKGVVGLFGGNLTGIFGGGTENFDAAVEKWGWLLDTWQDNLEYERKLMKEAYGTKVTDIQKKTEADLRRTQQAAAEIYRGWADDGAGWFSHSNGYEANRDANWRYLWEYDKDLAKRMGVSEYQMWGQTMLDNGDIKNLFNLSASELKNLKYNNSQFWQSLSETARQYLDQVIAAEEEIEQLRQEAMEQLTATSFDSITSDFERALTDMDASAEDFAEHFEEYMKSAVINSLMLSTYKKQLEEWYKNFAEAMESDDKLTEQEQAALRQQYEDIVNSALRERDALKNAMGWEGGEYKQNASSKGFQSMSQDTGNELNGRFTAIQIGVYDIKDLAVVANQMLADLSRNGGIVAGRVEAIQDAIALSNVYLSRIDKNSKSTNEKLDILKEMRDQLNKL